MVQDGEDGGLDFGGGVGEGIGISDVVDADEDGE